MEVRLNLKDWVEYVPDRVEEQVHVHHCKPGKGNDKLYIKRIPSGAIAYCHHCSQRGYVSNRLLSAGASAAGSKSRYVSGFDELDSPELDIRKISRGRTEGNDTESRKVVLPIDAVNQVKRWSSPEAKVWILKNGFSMEEIENAGICWSDSFTGILFPRFLEGELVAFQVRKFPESKPKYRTYGNTKGIYDALEPRERPYKRTSLVLVEDMLSALKVARIAPAFALGGTAIKDDQLLHLLRRYSSFVIMLDNDNWQVKANQTKLYKRLSSFTRDVCTVEVNKDPKEHSLEALERLIP